MDVSVKEIYEHKPTHTSKTNPSYAYSYDANYNLQYIDMTIGSDTYRKTLTYTDGRLTAESAWVKQ